MCSTIKLPAKLDYKNTPGQHSTNPQKEKGKKKELMHYARQRSPSILMKTQYPLSQYTTPDHIQLHKPLLHIRLSNDQSFPLPFKNI